MARDTGQTWNLRELILNVKGTDTYEMLAKRAGDVLSVKTWERYGEERPLTRMPAAASIEAIAKGLDVPVEVVFDAAGRSIGLSISRNSGGAQIMFSGMEDLPADQLAALRTMIRMWVSNARSGGEAEDVTAEAEPAAKPRRKR